MWGKMWRFVEADDCLVNTHYPVCFVHMNKIVHNKCNVYFRKWKIKKKASHSSDYLSGNI